MQFLLCNQRWIYWKRFIYKDLADQFELAEENAEMRQSWRQTEGKKKAEEKNKRKGNPGFVGSQGIVGGEGLEVVADEENRTIIKERVVKVRDEGNLDVQAQVEKGGGVIEIPEPGQSKSEQGRVLEEQKDERYIWYSNIEKDLNDATRDIRKGENPDEYRQKRTLALEELRKRLPQIDEAVNKYRMELYWASKGIIEDWKWKNAWSSKVTALGFLRDRLGIDKNGVDKPLVVVTKEEMETADNLNDRKETRGGLLILNKEEIKKHKSDEYLDPKNKLIILGDLLGEVGGRTYRLNENPERGKFGDEARVAVLRELVQKGFDVRVIGVHLNIRENGDVEFSTDLNKIDRAIVMKLVQEIEEQNNKFDEGKFSDELRKFFGGNLDKFRMTKDLLYRDEVSARGTKGEDGEENVLERKIETSDKLVWYDGIGADLWFATDNLDPVKDKGNFQRKKEAIDRLKVYFPDIEKKILGNESSVEILKLHWASKALKQEELKNNPWTSKEAALDFLKNSWKIGMGGVEVKKVETDPVEKTVEKPGVLLSEENLLLQELKATAEAGKWEAVMAEINALPAKERENKFLILVALARIQRNKRFLDKDIDPDGKIAKFWAEQKSRLMDLGVKLV